MIYETIQVSINWVQTFDVISMAHHHRYEWPYHQKKDVIFVIKLNDMLVMPKCGRPVYRTKILSWQIINHTGGLRIKRSHKLTDFNSKSSLWKRFKTKNNLNIDFKSQIHMSIVSSLSYLWQNKEHMQLTQVTSNIVIKVYTSSALFYYYKSISKNPSASLLQQGLSKIPAVVKRRSTEQMTVK